MSEPYAAIPSPTHLAPDTSAQPRAMLPPRAAEVDHITILAHDLRNYLAPAYAHLTALYGRAYREQREVDMRAAACGKQALDHALALAEHLLDAARIEHGLLDMNLEPLNLSRFVQHTAVLFESGDRPITVRVPETLLVLADRDRLRQVLHNLLANALAYAPRGEPITLELVPERHADAGWAVLLVCNRGPVIPAHMVAKLFQRFSAGPGSRGLGLGLYLARGIVEAHGGTLTAYSHPSAGTCFTVALPLANQ